jgi:hypothetical protein
MLKKLSWDMKSGDGDELRRHRAPAEVKYRKRLKWEMSSAGR